MEAIPILDAEAKTVADKFVERIVSIFGVPLQIHSDQGSNFESKVFKEMCISLIPRYSILLVSCFIY
jgi:hypothetical protein